MGANERSTKNAVETSSGHRERLRGRYLSAGLDSLLDYERLELLLLYAIPRRDVKPVAKRLIDKFKTLSGVMDAPLEELVKIKGMGPNSAVLCKLLKDLCTLYLGEQMHGADVLSNAEQVAKYARAKLGAIEVESIMVIYVNIKNMVVWLEEFRGTVDQALVYPRNLMHSALRHHASGLILVHNHPSGICSPSPADETLTMRIQEAGRTMGIKVLDHLIVSRATHYSFKAEGKL